MIDFRQAFETDVAELILFDQVAQREEGRREYIRREIDLGNCYVALKDETVIGYGVLNYNFYEYGLIDMLYIHAGHRRSGTASALLRHLESLCRTPKLFTSTNLSNLPMQSLLAKLGYELSGVIHNLDDGDPEIVYYKRLF